MNCQWNTNGTPMEHQKSLRALIIKAKGLGVPQFKK